MGCKLVAASPTTTMTTTTRLMSSSVDVTGSTITDGYSLAADADASGRLTTDYNETPSIIDAAQKCSALSDTGACLSLSLYRQTCN